ncbi:hypothetical protein BT96DRAFT_52875 [Gymnopus androsaceus JB14]|uniref:Uncharacterized protein n=1 Tax=Gymnopus androsaceus JB14 TaxID=1447944 RepID=A0A6A4IGI9_9AGAR|nr:hypothetical protein BT96DRAFT_52875 [Gymnopus androsaceus JB14]
MLRFKFRSFWLDTYNFFYKKNTRNISTSVYDLIRQLQSKLNRSPIGIHLKSTSMCSTRHQNQLHPQQYYLRDEYRRRLPPGLRIP